MKYVQKYKLQLIKEKSVRYEDIDKVLNNPRDTAAIARPLLENEAEEVLIVIALDVKCKIIGVSEVSRGSLNAAIVHPREVYKRALMMNAAKIIIAHNHPSGDPKPSNDDVEITRTIRDAGEMLQMTLIDHIIIGDTEFKSLKEMGIF